MPIEICAVGGYNEVGGNMTAIKYGDEVIICDMGFFMEKIIEWEGEEEIQKLSPKKLIEIRAIPNDAIISDWMPYVKAIVPSHAHLDHVGAVPYLANKYNCPIIATPYTLEILNSLVKESNITIQNEIIRLNPNSSIKISKNITIELVHITHSVPQASLVAIHTPEGVIVYANDFKLDLSPVLGKKPNFARMKQLGSQGVKCLIMESLYADCEQKTPSEKIALEMLKDILLGTHNEGSLIIVTTFASHIARLKSIVECGKKLGRKIVFLGRSLHKYVSAAEKINLVNFSKSGVDIVPYSSLVNKKLNEIEKEGREKYLVVCTGHQGEQGAVLWKIASGKFNFKLKKEDHIIFSSKIIPAKRNFKNREELEKMLRHYHARIFKEVHVSGHSSLEDLKDTIYLLKPEHLIPSHGGYERTQHLEKAALAMGYKSKKNLHVMRDGKRIKI